MKIATQTSKVKGQFFSPTSPSHGEAISAYTDQTELVIAAANPEAELIRLPLSALKPRYGGFNREQVYFDWESAQGDACSVCFSAVDAQQLMAQAQPSATQQYQQVHRAQTKRKRRSHIGLGMLALYLVLPFLLLLVLLWKSHQIAAWIADYIPVEQEQMLGEMVFASATDSMKLRQTGYDYEVLRSIGARLTQGSVYEYQWYIADTDEVNAFAIPGGYVVANTGLLQKAESAEEVAGVIAHEVQHVEQRHSLENIIYDLGWQASIALMVGDASSLWVTQALTELSGLKFSRELETDADLKGLAALHQAQIAPQGLVTFFEKLAKEEASVDLPAFLSTHPPSEKRSAILQTAIKQREGWATSTLPYDWKRVQNSIPPN